MMVKGASVEASSSPDDSLAGTGGELDSSASARQHQLYEEPLTKSTSARHKLKFTSSRTRLWRNISRKRSASHGSSKMTSGIMADELVIEDSDIILQDSVQLTNCLQTQQRFLFLLSQILVVAKQKSSANFHVKDEIRLSEIWLADCIDQVSEVVCDRERSFVIGWPTVNLVVTFASIQLKDVWLNRLQEQIALEKSQEWPPNVVIKIINTSQAFSVTKSLLVQNCDEARDILARCVQEMHISSASVNDFQFWVQSEKENHPYPLIGHEYPYAIQMNYIRDKKGSSECAVLTDISLYDGLKFQIVRKQSRSKLSLKLSLDETRMTPKKTSKIVRLFKKSSRSVEVGNIFGHDLSDLVDGDVLRPPVMDILSHLFVHGPFTVDIFRKSAIVSKCHEAKQHLDQGYKVDFDDVHVGVSAALLKELLRCLPNCLLLCELYSKWIKISAVIDNPTLANHRLKSLIQILPPSHRIFLRYLMCILHHISLRSEHNGMTAYSLSICISPSLLWPRSSTGAALSQVNDAKKLNAVVEQMIESAGEIFGPDCLHLFDHLIPQWNRSQDGVAKGVQRTNLSLDIVKEESLVGGPEQDVNATPSSAPGFCSTDVTPISASHDSGLATSNSALGNDSVMTTALVDCSLTAEADISNDTEQSVVTPGDSVTCSSSMERKKCKFQGISGWFHLAFEDDAPFQSHLKEKYSIPERVRGSLLESCMSDSNSKGRNLSAEIGSETESVTAGILNNLNMSSTDFLRRTESFVGTEHADVITDCRVLDTSSSLDESWKGGLSTKHEVEKIDMNSFAVEQDSSALDSEANKSVLSSKDFHDISSETVSLSCQSLPSADLQRQTLSNALLSFDVPDSQHIKRCEGRTGFVAEAEKQTCVPEPGLKRDEILCSPLSVRDVLRREQTHTCVNSSAVGSKARSLNLRRGMTKCGSDIFPKCFLEGLHCTFGEVLLGRCEEERLAGENCGLTQTKSPVLHLHGQMGIPHHVMVRPRGGLLAEGHQVSSSWCPVVPRSFNSGQRVRPARPPSYAEAIAAKALQNGSFGSSPSGQNAAGVTSLSQITESHSAPSIVSTDRNEEDGLPTLPSSKSVVRCECNPTVLAVTVVTCSVLSHASQSDPLVTGAGIGTTIQSIPSIGSKTVNAVSASPETLVTCKLSKATGQCGERDSEPHLTQASVVTDESSSDIDTSQHTPLIGSKLVSRDYSDCPVNRLSQTISKVRSESTSLQNGVCAFMAKQRSDQKVRVRKRRQHSSDPKLHSRQAFGLGLGRSKSDSCEILEKKRQECNNAKNKENILVSSNSFLKRKLAAMKQASEEKGQNASYCSSHDKSAGPYDLAVVSEENSAYAGDAEREPAYSPQDMKKKKSVLFERRDRQNEGTTIHSSPLHVLQLSNTSQHEMRAFHQDAFSEVRIKRALPLNRRMFSVPQPKSLKGNCFPIKSFSSASNSSDELDTSLLKSSSASDSSPGQHSYVFRAAKQPIPRDAIKINWSVSKLKQMYSNRGGSQSSSSGNPQRMIALHDSPYFV